MLSRFDGQDPVRQYFTDGVQGNKDDRKQDPPEHAIIQNHVGEYPKEPEHCPSQNNGHSLSRPTAPVYCVQEGKQRYPFKMQTSLRIVLLTEPTQRSALQQYKPT